MKKRVLSFKVCTIKANVLYVALLVIFGLGIALNVVVVTATAQVKIGHKATRLDAPASTIILQLSNDTSKANETKAAKSFVMPSVKASQRKEMEGNGKKVPEGLFIYNVDSAMLELYVKEDKASGGTSGQYKWKFLRYANANSGKVAFLKIRYQDLESGKIPKEDGTNSYICVDKKDELTFKASPYSRPKHNVDFTDPTPQPPPPPPPAPSPKHPRTRITYNGLTLAPGRDYKVELNSAANGGANQKVKVTFLTLVPEKWDEFDEFFIEYEII